MFPVPVAGMEMPEPRLVILVSHHNEIIFFILSFVSPGVHLREGSEMEQQMENQKEALQGQRPITGEAREALPVLLAHR